MSHTVLMCVHSFLAAPNRIEDDISTLEREINKLLLLRAKIREIERMVDAYKYDDLRDFTPRDLCTVSVGITRLTPAGHGAYDGMLRDVHYELSVAPDVHNCIAVVRDAIKDMRDQLDDLIHRPLTQSMCEEGNLSLERYRFEIDQFSDYDDVQGIADLDSLRYYIERNGFRLDVPPDFEINEYMHDTTTLDRLLDEI